MDFDQLNAYCTLAQCNSYRLAAERLCITQSALTKKIQRLEATIGSPLFERGRKGATLTLVGETLLDDAQRLVASFGQFKEFSLSVSQGTTGHLKIGFGISTLYEAPRHIAQFKKSYPNVKVTLNDIPSKTQYTMLEDGDLHLSFNRLPDSGSFGTLSLYIDRLVVAVHDSVTIDPGTMWEELRNRSYLKLASPRGPGLSRQIEQYLAHQDLNLRVEQQADDILTLLGLVSANLGFTIIPVSAQLIDQPNIQYVALQGAYSSWDVGLIWKEPVANPLVSRFIEGMSADKR
ncbi:LysR family transcriptional regulator [Vibrio mexicanus]|uniref:LysR family transcriptional regulator n=1 Tax=Vibrio mexicanus TaxID=1004326 RepID=UPI00063BFE0E|nr:LysR family transcriptional regulator [Vibrio mexicanus]